jgi:hypothetical protein
VGFGPIVKTCCTDTPSGETVVAAQVVTNAEGYFSLSYAEAGFASVSNISALPLGPLLAVELHSATPAALQGRVLTHPLTALLGRRRAPAVGVTVYLRITGV